MKPLLFLTYRSFLNGIKRALGSPTRLIGLLFFIGYYFMMFMRPALTGSGKLERAMRYPMAAGPLEFPPLQVLDALAFTVFAGLSLFMTMGVFSQQGGFKPADVDVLFPTPLSPRVVLAFRMIRDYLLTLIVPFFFLLFGFVPAKAGWEAFFRNVPNKEYAPLVLRTSFGGWILMAMSWVAINYAVSLTLNKGTEAGDRLKRLVSWAVGAIVVGTAAYIAWRLSQAHNARGVLAIASEPLLRVVFLPATLASRMAMAPLEGSLAEGLIGVAGLLGLLGGALFLAFRQAPWLYEESALKATSGIGLKKAQREGDIMGASAEMAKQGKRKTRRFRWLADWQTRGPWALLWKDLLLQFRGMMSMLALLFGVGLFMTLGPLLFPDKDESLSPGAMFLVMQGFALLMATMSLANAGYLELLRRVDLQKPLPFRPTVTVLFEVASKSSLGIAVCLVASALTVALRPGMWPEALAAVILVPPMAILMSAIVFFVIILFPDMDDQTQRQFRGLMQMLALAVLAFPPVLTFMGLLVLRVPPYVGALVAAAIASGIGWVVVMLAGRQYANFNPSE
ncbi:MAG: hypothetical protein HZC36_15625 [Armatimonadetes bacterium]|nr:hypothetical protein [Armatimonadota bacterium]